MKKSLAAALIALVAPALLASPAGAAVPKTKPKSTHACPDEPGKSARVWTRQSKGKLTTLAVDNPCSSFLALAWGEESGGAPEYELKVAPGVHFNWGKSRLRPYQRAGFLLSPPSVHFHADGGCEGQTAVDVLYKYNDVRSPDC